MIDIEKVKREINDLDVDIKDAFSGNATNYDVAIIKNAINELERLQAKEIPMKVIDDKCPICKSSLVIEYWDNIEELTTVRIKIKGYCNHCGQRIDFGG